VLHGPHLDCRPFVGGPCYRWFLSQVGFFLTQKLVYSIFTYEYSAGFYTLVETKWRGSVSVFIRMRNGTCWWMVASVCALF
jgi:hypothetical protein